MSSSIALHFTSDHREPASTSQVSASTASTLTPEQEAVRTREKLESDLQNWQEKFAKAAEKGAEDLRERVKVITDRQIESQVHGVGRSLVIQLEESSTSEIKRLKAAIVTLIRNLPRDATKEDFDRAEDELSRSTRNAGLAVKEKAQALRTWRKGFEEETLSLVQAASKSTLEVIDSIRDLGLQEVGMRWALMEGVTYEDWSNYHLLKKTFDKWRTQVEEVELQHDGLQRAKEAASEVDNRGMAVAEEAAKHLGSLKEAGKWKIHARDLSDDFSTRYIPAAAAAAVDDVIGKILSATDEAEHVASAAKAKIGQVIDGASEAVIGTPLPVYESLASAASESLKSAASGVSNAIPGSSTPLTESASSAVSSVSSSISSAASVASKKVFSGAMAQKVEKREPILDDELVDEKEETYSEKLWSIVDKAGDRYADVTNAVSDALLQQTSEQSSLGSITSLADEQYSRAIAAASSVLYGTQQGTAESVTSLVSGKYAEAVAA